MATSWRINALAEERSVGLGAKWGVEGRQGRRKSFLEEKLGLSPPGWMHADWERRGGATFLTEGEVQERAQMPGKGCSAQSSRGSWAGPETSRDQ